jgi:hypothetical protein
MSTELLAQDFNRERKRAINRAYYHRNKLEPALYQSQLNTYNSGPDSG